jgi:hypothetical protein
MEHMDATHTTAPSACTSPGADATPPSATPAAGVQTERAVVTVLAADWPTTAYVPGRYLAASVPDTIDLLVDGRPVTVGLQWDVGGEERPYVADAPEELTLAECEAIDAAVAAAWEARCADELAEGYDTGRGWREVA